MPAAADRARHRRVVAAEIGVNARRIGVLLLLVAALGAYLYCLRGPEGASRRRRRTSSLAVDKDDVTGDRPRLPRPRDRAPQGRRRWRLTKPIDAPADDAAVKALRRARSPTPRSRSRSTSCPTDLAAFGLDQPSPTVRPDHRKGRRCPPIAVGKNTAIGGKTYVRDGDEPKVYLTASTLGVALNKQVKDLRDKQLLTFQDDDVTRVDIAPTGRTTGHPDPRKDKDAWTLEPGDHPADHHRGALLPLVAALDPRRRLPGRRDADLGKYGPRHAAAHRHGRRRQGRRRRRRCSSATRARRARRSRSTPSASGQPDDRHRSATGRFRTLGKDAAQFRDKTVLGFDAERVGKDRPRAEGRPRRHARPRRADGGWEVEGADSKSKAGDHPALRRRPARAARRRRSPPSRANDLSGFGLDAPDLRIALDRSRSSKPIGTVLAARSTTASTTRCATAARPSSRCATTCSRASTSSRATSKGPDDATSTLPAPSRSRRHARRRGRRARTTRSRRPPPARAQPARERGQVSEQHVDLLVGSDGDAERVLERAAQRSGARGCRARRARRRRGPDRPRTGAPARSSPATGARGSRARSSAVVSAARVARMRATFAAHRAAGRRARPRRPPAVRRFRLYESFTVRRPASSSGWPKARPTRRPGERERLRERAQHDDVVQAADQRHARRASAKSTYASSTTSTPPTRTRERLDVGERHERARRRVGVAEERDARARRGQRRRQRSSRPGTATSHASRRPARRPASRRGCRSGPGTRPGRRDRRWRAAAAPAARRSRCRPGCDRRERRRRADARARSAVRLGVGIEPDVAVDGRRGARRAPRRRRIRILVGVELDDAAAGRRLLAGDVGGNRAHGSAQQRPGTVRLAHGEDTRGRGMRSRTREYAPAYSH